MLVEISQDFSKGERISKDDGFDGLHFVGEDEVGEGREGDENVDHSGLVEVVTDEFWWSWRRREREGKGELREEMEGEGGRGHQPSCLEVIKKRL